VHQGVCKLVARRISTQPNTHTASYKQADKNKGSKRGKQKDIISETKITLKKVKQP